MRGARSIRRARLEHDLGPDIDSTVGDVTAGYRPSLQMPRNRVCPPWKNAAGHKARFVTLARVPLRGGGRTGSSS